MLRRAKARVDKVNTLPTLASTVCFSLVSCCRWTWFRQQSGCGARWIYPDCCQPSFAIRWSAFAGSTIRTVTARPDDRRTRSSSRARSPVSRTPYGRNSSAVRPTCARSATNRLRSIRTRCHHSRRTSSAGRGLAVRAVRCSTSGTGNPLPQTSAVRLSSGLSPRHPQNGG